MGTQQPNPNTVITIQKGEIDRLNDNRIYLMALIEEIKAEAQTEVGRLSGVISQLRALVPMDDDEKAEAIVAGG